MFCDDYYEVTCCHMSRSMSYVKQLTSDISSSAHPVRRTHCSIYHLLHKTYHLLDQTVEITKKQSSAEDCCKKKHFNLNSSVMDDSYNTMKPQILQSFHYFF
jgi:hypothetical protein